MSADPAYMRDFATAARMADVAYASSLLHAGMSSSQIAGALSSSNRPSAADVEFVSYFSQNYTIISSTGDNPSLSKNGLDALVVQDLNGARFVLIAGVNSASDLTDTVIHTDQYGFNDLQYADLKTMLSTALAVEGAPITLIGHSLGGQLARVAFADLQLQGRDSELHAVETFSPYGVNQSAALLDDGKIYPESINNWKEILGQLKIKDPRITNFLMNELRYQFTKYTRITVQLWGHVHKTLN